tara:strand:+ start:44 stop:412 length:369 start_codon:yes stop_codon:yes gene_type:complete
MSRKVPAHSEKLDNVVIETDKGLEFTVGEIKHSNRIVKSATPKQDLSWYIKWVSSFFILASMSMRGVEGLQMYDLLLSIIGVAGWMWVGFLWKDRALILLNGVGIILFSRTLFQDYLGPLLM